MLITRGQDDQLDSVIVGGPGGPVAETKNVVPRLPVFPRIVDYGPSQHRGSVNARVAAALLDLSAAHGAPGGVGGPGGQGAGLRIAGRVC